jgi:hypothetical protein
LLLDSLHNGLACVLLTALLLSGCAATPDASRSSSAAPGAYQPLTTGGAGLTPSEPADEPTGALGLEVRWWVVDDAADELLGVVRGHGGRVDFLPAARQRELTRHGFRLLRLPVGRFAAFAEELTVSSRLSSDWLAQAGRWTGVMPGPWLPAGEVVQIEGRRVYLPTGRFELALRTWIVPTGGEPYLQLELLPRFEPSGERSLASLAGEAGRRRPVVEALTRLRLERGYVYLLTADSPGADWQTPASPDADADVEAASGDGEEVEALVGPITPTTPTVGELLLRPSQAAGTPGLGRRAVAVFLPYLPREASLLPPTQ